MRKKGIAYIATAVFIAGLLLVLEYNKPKKLNWFPSYVAHHKIPYGTKVLNDLAKNWFKDIKQVKELPYQFLTNNEAVQGTYFFVNDNVNFDEVELDKILAWTAKGNTLFVASNYFEEKFLDTLHLATAGLYDPLIEDKGQLHQLVNPNLTKEKGFPIKKDSYTSYFKEIDTLTTTVLGVVDHLNPNLKIETKHINAIAAPFGNGKIILTTFPKAFTNYFILKDDNKDYTAGLLSYLDEDSTLYIDNHYKSGKSTYSSPMHIFLNNKALKWAYYLALIGALIYVIFEGKRKQRAIPLVLPLQNQTLAFTRTIADMYFEKKEQKQIAEHKIAYFLEHIRSKFYMSTITIDEVFYRNLASRSLHSTAEIKDIFKYLNNLKTKDEVSDAELIKLNRTIEKFKTRADGRK